MQYNILDFGALGDGLHNDTAAIQAAIDACHAAGGGRVLFPGGRVYRSGALVLRSDLELHLEITLSDGRHLQAFGIGWYLENGKLASSVG